jgi:capsular exopolysaccharide synthesis family protein
MLEENFNYRKWLFLIAIHWPLFVLSFSSALLFSYLFRRYVVRTYTVSATVLIKTNKEGNIPFMANYANYKNSTQINNEINIIKSYSTIEKALKGLDFGINYYSKGHFRIEEIYPNTSFKVITDSASSQKYINRQILLKVIDEKKYSLTFLDEIEEEDLKPVIGHYGDTIDFKGMKLHISILNYSNLIKLSREGEILFQVNNIPFMAIDFRGRLGVYAMDKEGSIISISVYSIIPAKEITFLNKLSEVYILSSLEDKNVTTNKSIDFINQQLGVIQDSISKYAYGLEFYRKKFKVNDITDQAEKGYTNVAELEKEKAAYFYKQNYFNYLKNYIKNKDSYGDIIMPASVGLDDPHMALLVSKIIELNMQKKMILKTESNRESPFVNENGRQIDEYKRTLHENMASVEKTNQMHLDHLNKQIEEIINKSSGLNSSERDFSHLKQMYEIYQQVYSFLLQKKVDAGINKASNVPDIKVVDYAAVAGPPTPDFDSIQSFAILLALGLPIAFIFLKDYLNTSILFKEDLIKFTNIPFLGVVGHNYKDTLAVIDSPKSSLAESFRSIRTNLLFLSPDKKNQVFLLTSSTSGEGKSFSSLNIAAVFAISGKKTVLIGADMRKPKIYGELGLSNENGLSNYLSGLSELDAVIQRTSVENMDFISAGTIPPNPVELIMGVRLEQMIKKLRKKYDYIIIDTPPIGLVVDAYILMKHSDTNIYVIRHNFTKRQSLTGITQNYKDGKFTSLNLILNDVKTNGIYGYGYGYGDGYGNTNYGYGYYSDIAVNRSTNLLNRLKKLIGLVSK